MKILDDLAEEEQKEDIRKDNSIDIDTNTANFENLKIVPDEKGQFSDLCSSKYKKK